MHEEEAARLDRPKRWGLLWFGFGERGLLLGDAVAVGFVGGGGGGC